MVQSIIYGLKAGFNLFLHINPAAVKAALPPAVTLYRKGNGQAVLFLTGFQFDEAPCGPFLEFMLGLVVEPWTDGILDSPDVSIVPLAVATDTEASRAHAHDCYRLPLHQNTLKMNFERNAAEIRFSIEDDATTAFSFTAAAPGAPETASAREHYQALYLIDGTLHLVRCNVLIDSSESKVCVKGFELFRHGLFAGLELGGINPVPVKARFGVAGTQIMFRPVPV